MNMYKYIATAILILCTATASYAGRKDDGKARFTYDVGFEMNFDNREFYRSSFSESMTIFGARLTPTVGVEIPYDRGSVNHKLMFGIDIMKNFGQSPVHALVPGAPEEELDPKQNNLNLFREITMYYRLDKRFDRTALQLYAGIFPRKTMAGSYSEAFFSDSLKFYDNNLEGLLIKVRRPKAYYEIGCDWMGHKGLARKEKFMVFFAGEGAITRFFRLGYSGYMLHFAGSDKARGVVDNVLLNPYARFDLGYKMNFQEFSIRLGWLQALQNDREFVGHYVFPGGGEIDIAMKKWDVAVRNNLFFGSDMMPYYNSTDTAGDKYGSRLYLGNPFYRIHDDVPKTYAGTYNLLEFAYEPRIGNLLTLKVAARFHFHNMTYSGTQQLVGILFNLNSSHKSR